MGGTRQINDQWSSFSENAYDLFGERRSLTNAYGLTYEASDYTSYTGSFEVARVTDSVNGDFDRDALSIGMRRETQKVTAAGRLEYRRDRGEINGTSRDGSTVLVTGDLKYKIDEERRILASVDASRSNSDGLVPEGDLVDFKLGYAMRPIANDRLNLLMRYRFLYDT